MKKLLIVPLLLTLIIVSCSKKGDPVTPNTPSQPSTPQNPNPTPTNTTARFIPNWQRDTLHVPLADVNGDFVYDSTSWKMLHDTIITYSINDTSFVEHNGIRYYLWWESILNTDTFVNNDFVYVNCMVSLSTTPNSEINEYLMSAYPYKYYDEDLKAWGQQSQRLFGFDFYVYHTTNPKYKTYTNLYTSIKTK